MRNALSVARRLIRRPAPFREIGPSFNARFDAERRTRRLLQAAGVDHPVWAVNDKDAAHAWAGRLGVRVPHLLAIAPSAAEIEWDDLPDAVVVKPVHGTMSRGVFLMRRVGGVWLCAETGRPCPPDRVAATHARLVAEGLVSRRVLVEELVVDANTGAVPPINWKIWTFFGEVGLVAGKRLLPGGGRMWRFFDTAWRDLGQVIADHRIDATIRPAVHGEALIEMARIISAASATTMLRCDLYDGVQGAVFGEITPEPGLVNRVLPPFDESLGRLWEAADARQRAGLMTDGALAIDRTAAATAVSAPSLELVRRA